LDWETRVNRSFGWILVTCLLASACGGDRDEPQPDPAPDSVAAALDEAPLPFDSIPMPDYPAPRRGRLVAVSAGPVELAGSWPAQAGICNAIGVLQVLAEAPGRGTLMLFQMPEDERVGTYPIMIVDSGAPVPPVAQVGVQVMTDGGTFGFQGDEGEIHLDTLDRDAATGRLEVTLREITSNDRVRYAGIFSRIPVTALPPAYCDEMASAMTAQTSPTTDTP
jgi:hypothetical protein